MSEPPPPADDPTWVDNVLARARARAQTQAGAIPATPPAAANADPFAVRQSPPSVRPTPAVRSEALPALRPETAPALRAQPARRSQLTDRAPRAEVATALSGAMLSDGPAPAPPAERRIMPTPVRTEFEPADRATVFDPDVEDSDQEGDEEQGASGLRNAVEWIAVAVGAVLVAFLIRAFLLQAFYIPSESMMPTLRENDRILVNKLSYRLHDVNRGDLIVFERPPSMPPDDNVKDLIKRVIALEGETIELRGNDIYIDERKLIEPYLPEGTFTVNLRWVNGCANPPSDSTKCTIPPGHVFVLGDNRSQSTDGRVFGPISEELIVGRAFLRVWPIADFKRL